MTLLPDNFYWSDVNIICDDELNELYTFLSNHYVEDTSGTLRFHYSKSLLRWALTPPNYLKEWHVGVRYKDKLCGFISAVPIPMNTGITAFINFLCVHKNIRNKRVAPVLIMELTRRINIFTTQAIYTGVKLKNKVVTATYWQRYLNVKKLLQHGVVSLSNHMTLKRIIKLYTLPTTLLKVRKMMLEDVPQICIILNDYLKKYKLYIIWKEEDIKHWFLSIETYVVEKENNIVAFFSYYCLDITILNTANTLHTAYLFYYALTDPICITSLISAALICAYNDGCDIFYCLDIMNNVNFLEPLKFVFSGKLNYYYTEQVHYLPNEIGFIAI
jgi:glycylpeptide N-tetradecanoyltransferase